jgi:hypothetical protein
MNKEIKILLAGSALLFVSVFFLGCEAFGPQKPKGHWLLCSCPDCKAYKKFHGKFGY